MNKEDIRIKNVIIHIMDSTIGMPVLSDTELEYGSEIAEFLKEHIARISSGDDACLLYMMPKSAGFIKKSRKSTRC